MKRGRTALMDLENRSNPTPTRHSQVETGLSDIVIQYGPISLDLGMPERNHIHLHYTFH